MIGADGLMSSVRAAFYPDEGNPVYSGQMLWRGVVEWEPMFDGRTCVMVGHNDLKAVVYPISEPARKRGRAMLNWVAERRLPGSLPPNPADWNRRGDHADFVGAFADWRFDWLDIPRMFAATEQVFEFPMVDRTPVPQWSFGRVTLLGDAAHAMRPNGSNGASQAILDGDRTRRRARDEYADRAGTSRLRDRAPRTDREADARQSRDRPRARVADGRRALSERFRKHSRPLQPRAVAGSG